MNKRMCMKSPRAINQTMAINVKPTTISVVALEMKASEKIGSATQEVAPGNGKAHQNH